MEPRTPHRLGDDVVPSAYVIDVDTDLEGGSFSGFVSIDAEVRRATDTIVCNAADLTVTAAQVRVGDRTVAAEWALDADAERLTLTVPEELAPGPIVIDVTFGGAFNDQLVGYYRSSYEVDGRTQYLAVTQFEAAHARRAFPCWDEPAFKATYEVRLTCDAGLLAVSNSTETARHTLDDGRLRYEFAPTMVMSTYLVAWVIGDLEVSESVPAGSTTLRVIHRPGHGDLTAFPLECGAHAVAWFEDYYGIDYPGDKLDLVAVPDFAFGAMENLGCVTFRENLLLVDPERSNRSEQERAATVIEHEIAHMWFGDLVTMQWWDGIWLNEAFATFMEFCCCDDFRPEWDIWTSFGLSRSAAFDTDALASTRAIQFEVETPTDAEGMFDILTYEKGASILRMFEQWAGPERFRDGVRAYLRRHSYANTAIDDLWSALAEATGTDVGAVMDTWILQGGHPVVHGTVGDDGALRLTQERFGYAGGDPAPAATWIVPVTVVGDGPSGPFRSTVLLGDDGASVDTGGAGAPTWFTLNAGFNGFYRSDAAPGAVDLAAAASALGAVDRYALVDDGWALFLAGHRSVAEVVATLRTVAAVETEASVWRRIAGITSSLALLAPPEARDAVAALARDLTAGRATTAPGPDATAADRDRHAVIVRLAGTVGHDPDVVADARRRFADAAAMADDADLAAAVTDVVAANGDAATFERLRTLQAEATTPQDELRALYALALVPDAELIARLCELCATEVRTQNAPFVLAQAMANPVAGAEVWRFVAARWDELVARFPSSSIVRMAGGIRAFADPALADEVAAFFDDHEVPSAGLTMRQHLERLRVNVAVRPRLAALADAAR